MKRPSFVLFLVILMLGLTLNALTSVTMISAGNTQLLDSPCLTVETNGPIELGLTDVQGNHTGYEPQTGQDSVQIPESTYSGVSSNPQIVTVATAHGEYLIEVYPAENGNFTLKIENSALAQIFRYTVSSNVRLNEKMDYWVRVLTDGSFRVFDCSSDLNSDYVVDIFDALILSSAFSTKPGDTSWREKADINKDEVVDIFDALKLSSNYGQKRIDYQTIEKGYFSGQTSAGYYVINNQEDWTSLWNVHQSIRTPQYPPPQINFSESIVIAVFMGEKATGGFTIEITSIAFMDQTLKIQVEQTFPGPHCYVAEVLTQPYHFVRLDATDRQLFSTPRT